MTRILVAAVLLGTLSACMVSDETRTYYLLPDGKIELVTHWDEVRSDSEEKATRDKEQAQWLKDFKSGAMEPFLGLRKAGAKVPQKVLLRDQVPFAAIMKAVLPSADALAKHLDLKAPEGSVTLTSSGRERKLTLTVEPNPASKGKTPSKPSSETRFYPVVKFVPVGGALKSTTHCQLNAAKQGCRVDLDAMENLTSSGKPFVLEMAWELTP